jgi:hypothetical protein
MPELIHKIKKDGQPLDSSVPSRLRKNPVDTSMFTAMEMKGEDLGIVEFFRARGFARTILVSRNVLYLIERIGTTRGLRSWALPVQALLTDDDPAPSQSDEGSRTVADDDPHDEALAEVASELIVEIQDEFRDDLDEPAPMPDPAIADEPADDVPIFGPAVAPAFGREIVFSPVDNTLADDVPTPAPVVSRALSREVVFSVATTASFLFGGILGLLVSRGAAESPTVRPDPGVIYEGRDPKFIAVPPTADPRRNVAKAQGDLREAQQDLLARQAELKELEGRSKEAQQDLAKLDADIRAKQKTRDSLNQEFQGLYDRLRYALDHSNPDKSPSENGQDPAPGRNARPGPGPQTRTGNPGPPATSTGPGRSRPRPDPIIGGLIHPGLGSRGPRSLSE